MTCVKTTYPKSLSDNDMALSLTRYFSTVSPTSEHPDQYTTMRQSNKSSASAEVADRNVTWYVL